MAYLKEISQTAFNQLFPNPSDETPVKVEEFIATAKVLYSTQMWIYARNEKNTEGVFNVPSFLLTEVEKEVVNNEMDISDLSIMRSLPSEVWLQNVGGFFCECEYVKSNVNQSQLLCDDEALQDTKSYFVIGNKIKFPRGTHKKNLSIIYANSGNDIEEDVYIDDALAGIIRDKLIDTYAGKIQKEDVTNNSNSTV